MHVSRNHPIFITLIESAKLYLVEHPVIINKIEHTDYRRGQMFQKKDIIFSETLGVCRVEDITKLSLNKGETSTPYYFLRSIYEKEKIAYIPVEHHEVLLRELISRKEAEELQERANKTEQKLTDLSTQEITYVLEKEIKIKN